MSIGVGAMVAGSLASAVGNGLFGMGGSAMSYKQSKKLMTLQYAMQRQLNRNAYQDTTYSMRQAGINPMLAIGNGASSGSVGLNSGSSPSGIDLDLTHAIQSAKQLENDTKRVKNETTKTASDAHLNDYLGDKAHEEAVALNNQNRSWDDYGRDFDFKTKEQEYKNAVLTGENIIANTAKAVNDINNNNRQTDAYVSSSMQSNKNSAQALKDAKRDYEFYKKHPVIYGVNKTFGSAAPLVNSAVRLAK